tara:strand:- start:4 stop:432 length:429 start_codon:yes stop_codon:yes gene_type:complete
MQNNRFLVFHASGVDSSSVISHDTGTDIDLACFPSSAVTAVMGEEDFVYIYFKDATRFGDGITGTPGSNAVEVVEQSYVRLGVSEGKEFDVVKDFTNAITSTGHGGYSSLVFDAVNDAWPIDNLTSIQIRRHLTTHTIASDS